MQACCNNISIGARSPLMVSQNDQRQAQQEDDAADEIEPPSIIKQQASTDAERAGRPLGGPLNLRPVSKQLDRQTEHPANLPMDRATALCQSDGEYSRSVSGELHRPDRAAIYTTNIIHVVRPC